jgi:hypothetical protein
MKIQRFLHALAILLMLAACDDIGPPPELKRGVQLIRWMTAPVQLSRSMYSTIQDGKASTWVSYFFSDMGAAEWPETEEAAERDPMIAEQAKSAGLPLAPKGVSFSADKPNPDKGRQIVLKADDARNIIIVEAYDAPSAKPLLVDEIPLAKVDPAPGVADLARGAMENGMSPQMRR